MGSVLGVINLVLEALSTRDSKHIVSMEEIKMDELWLFIKDVTRDFLNTRIAREIAVVLVVTVVLTLLYYTFPIIVGLYVLLFIVSWNDSVAQIFNLPLMTLERANALCILSAVVIVPLLFVASLFGKISK